MIKYGFNLFLNVLSMPSKSIPRLRGSPIGFFLFLLLLYTYEFILVFLCFPIVRRQ